MAFNRKYVETMRPLIAYKYFTLNESPEVISKELKISPSAIRTACNHYQNEDLNLIFDDNKAFIVVDKRDVDQALRLLNGQGLDAERLSNNHTVVQEFESSINIKID